jgi:hypothetical protein
MKYAGNLKYFKVFKNEFIFDIIAYVIYKYYVN